MYIFSKLIHCDASFIPIFVYYENNKIGSVLNIVLLQ